MLKILYVLSWLIFIGVCIEAGGFITNAVFTLIRPAVVSRLWHEADLSGLLAYNRWYFFILTLFMSIVAVLRACMFYQIIKILHDRKLDMSQPFSRAIQRFILKLSLIALLIGLFSGWGVTYADGLVKQGVAMPGVQYLRLGGADVWLFMSVVLFVIAQMFRRGIEIQSENELTI
jgi:hypothetical protein